MKCLRYGHPTEKIAYVSQTGKMYQIFQIPADGSGPPNCCWKGHVWTIWIGAPTGKIICSDFVRGRPILAFFSPGEKSPHETHLALKPASLLMRIGSHTPLQARHSGLR